MPSANPVTDALGYTPATSNAGKTTSAKDNGMGQDTFMKLLVAQMRMQNPMEPSDDKEMIAQMTQFSMLEQITNLATSSAMTASAGNVSQAVALLGRPVTYTDADGAAQSGTVEKVSFADGLPVLTIGGVQGIKPSQVTEVR
jgi:flagellar basal-body rod modification protein FlgD